QWMRTELLPALDELFSILAPGTQVIRIDTLELDFGNLPANSYRQIIREHLVQKLSQLIKSKSVLITSESPLSPSVHDPRAAVTQFLHYLQTGALTIQLFSSTSAASDAQKKLHHLLFETVADLNGISQRLRLLPNRRAWLDRFIK